MLLANRTFIEARFFFDIDIADLERRIGHQLTFLNYGGNGTDTATFTTSGEIPERIKAEILTAFKRNFSSTNKSWAAYFEFF